MSTCAMAVAASKNPQEALQIIAINIDTLLGKLDDIEAQLAELREQPDSDGWGEWTAADLAAVKVPGAFTTEVEAGDDGDHITIDIAPVDEEKRAMRRELAQSLDLNTHFPDLEPDAVECYVKGGPLWLYHGDRDFLDGLPYGVKQLMVADVEEDDPEYAHGMGADLLKAEPGTKMALVHEED